MVNNNNLMSPSSKRFDENVNQIQHPRLQSSIVDSAFTNAQKAKDHDKMIFCELLESDQHRLRFLNGVMKLENPTAILRFRCKLQRRPHANAYFSSGAGPPAGARAG